MASMDLMALLSTIVLVATITTTIFAVAAYAVSRGYAKRRVKTKGLLDSQPAATAVAASAKKAAPAQIAAAPILKRYNPYNAA